MCDTKIAPKIIFLGGVHGVGKTFLSKELCVKFGLSHYSASELIKEYKGIDFPKDKRIKDICNNQDVLISAIQSLVSNEFPILLDGHFCLINENGDVSDIPSSTFVELSPEAMIVLHDSPKEIHRRLLTRGKDNHDIEFIEYFQSRELIHSEIIAERIDRPLLKHDTSGDQVAIHNYIEKIILRGGDL